jgi:hypothetical protein
MRRVAAIGSCRNVTAKAGGASRPSVAARAAINEPGTNRQTRFDVAGAVTKEWSNSLQPCELALKELSSASNCAKGITLDDEHGGV